MATLVDLQVVPNRVFQAVKERILANRARYLERLRQAELKGPTRPRVQRLRFNAAINAYRRPEPSAQRPEVGGIVCARIDRGSDSIFGTGLPGGVIRISNGDSSLYCDIPISDFVWQFDNSYADYLLPLDKSTAVLVIVQLRRLFGGYVWADGFFNADGESFYSRNVPGTPAIHWGAKPAAIQYLGPDGTPRVLEPQGPFVGVNDAIYWQFPSTIWYPMSTYKPWEFRIPACFLVSKKGARRLDVPAVLTEKLRQALIHTDGGPYNTSQARFGKIGEFTNYNLLSNIGSVSHFAMKGSGGQVKHFTPSIYTGLSGAIDWFDGGPGYPNPILQDYGQLKSTYYQLAPSFWLDRYLPRSPEGYILPRDKEGYAQWGRSKRPSTGPGDNFPESALAPDRSFDVRTLGIDEVAPYPSYDINPPGGTRYSFAWDWGKPQYCRAQLLALGFAAADLKP